MSRKVAVVRGRNDLCDPLCESGVPQKSLTRRLARGALGRMSSFWSIARLEGKTTK